MTQMCYVCDDLIRNDEPRLFVDSLMIHAFCDVDDEGESTCDTEGCAYRWCVHGGAHIL